MHRRSNVLSQVALAALVGCAAKGHEPAAPVAPAVAQTSSEAVAIDGGLAPALDGGAAPAMPSEPAPGTTTQIASGGAAAETPPSAKSAKVAKGSKVAKGKAGHHRLLLKMHGAGAITGRVSSLPAGIACESPSDGGVHDATTCEAMLPAGSVTLTFEAMESADVAQFSIVRGVAQRELCATETTKHDRRTTCTLTLDGATEVEVFPISIPPPQPKPKR